MAFPAFSDGFGNIAAADALVSGAELIVPAVTASAGAVFAAAGSFLCVAEASEVCAADVLLSAEAFFVVTVCAART